MSPESAPNVQSSENEGSQCKPDINNSPVNKGFYSKQNVNFSLGPIPVYKVDNLLIPVTRSHIPKMIDLPSTDIWCSPSLEAKAKQQLKKFRICAIFLFGPYPNLQGNYNLYIFMTRANQHIW